MRNIFLNPYRFSFSLFIEDGKDGDGGGESAVDKAARELAEKAKEKEPLKKDAVDNDDDDDAEAKAEEAAELEQAKNIIKILKDPAGRKLFAKSLLAKEGIDDDSTDKDKKKAIRNIKTIVKKHLGDEYDVLSDRFEGILTEFAELFEEEKITPFKRSIAEKEETERSSITQTAWDKVMNSFNESDKLKATIDKLSDENPPVKGWSAEKYFNWLFKLAAEEKGIKLTPRTAGNKDAAENFNESRRERNRNDAQGRLASEGSDEGKVKSGPKQYEKVEDAINDVAEQVALKMGLK